MLIVNTRPPKVCFTSAGDVICLPDENGNPIDDPYLVCVFTLDKLLPKKILASNGLYSSEDSYFLVNLRTGLPKKMPHLSSRRVPLADVFLSYDLPK